ncbi:leucine--tRNA ligase [bacterium]|nr:leucine--tRNA ligase [bacterium]
MTERYPHQEVEAKWRRHWQETESFRVDLARAQRQLYTLVMFSYPSGDRLHIGHWYNYGPADSWARFKKMQGYTIFEPMGFDSFGLPAENYAIKHGVHPAKSTRSNIDFITGQLNQIGAMYDWDHAIETSSPQYYKWTQWLFLTLFKHDLAYQSEAPVNWCESCGTVLANEQVHEGHCERCENPVIRKEMKQWFFRITSFADELLAGLDHLDWPEKTRKLQTNWIGRSEGTHITFKIKGSDEIDVFTTRPDTLYGVTYVVFAPEHPLVEKVASDEQWADVSEYITLTRSRNEIERTSTEREKTGVFTGAYVIHPLTGAELPIWIADYVLASYGTGIVMAVPAHDERDFEFARKFDLPVRVVITQPGTFLDPSLMETAFTEPGVMVNSSEFNGLPSSEGGRLVTEHLARLGSGEQAVTYRLRDWLISRQRYWGAPIPIIHCESCGPVPVPEEELPVLLPEDVDFRPRGKAPLATNKQFMAATCPQCGEAGRRDPDTMDTFVCSSWYYLRYLSPNLEDKPWDPELVKRWLPVAQYVGGSEHATMHLLYARFIARALHSLGLLHFQEPFTRLVHQGIITRDGDKMSKSRGNIVSPDDFLTRYGSDVFRMYMMFMGDYGEGGDWSDTGITGIERFRNRVWRAVGEWYQPEVAPAAAELPKETNRILHYTIQQVTRDIEQFSFNTALSRLMELVNEIYRVVQLPENSRPATAGLNFLLTRLVQLVAPFAPHLGEELWQQLGHETSIFAETWPTCDEQALQVEEQTIVIQINGKVRDSISVPVDIDQKELEQIVLQRERVQQHLSGKQLQKLIVVPGKLVSLVVKS